MCVALVRVVRDDGLPILLLNLGIRCSQAAFHVRVALRSNPILKGEDVIQRIVLDRDACGSCSTSLP